MRLIAAGRKLALFCAFSTIASVLPRRIAMDLKAGQAHQTRAYQYERGIPQGPRDPHSPSNSS